MPIPYLAVTKMAGLTPQEKLDLINVNLQEVLKPKIIEEIVFQQKRPLKIYWGTYIMKWVCKCHLLIMEVTGTATTGRPHCGYFVCIVKIAQFLRAGCIVKILLADVHGFLDNLKAPEELVGFRAEYYRFVITALLKAVNVPVERLEFILGSSYQESKPYIRDLYRLSTAVTEHDAKKAGSEVVKQVSNTVMSSLIYPMMQVLDEEHLGVDVQFGGVDQRKIFTLATEALPRIGYKERAHLMNPMVPGLAGGKMSSSDLNSKIDILDTPEQVTKKLRKAEAIPKVTEGNGIISFVEYVLLPVSSLQHGGNGRFVVETVDGEPLVYESIEILKKDYEADKARISAELF